MEGPSPSIHFQETDKAFRCDVELQIAFRCFVNSHWMKKEENVFKYFGFCDAVINGVTLVQMPSDKAICVPTSNVGWATRLDYQCEPLTMGPYRCNNTQNLCKNTHWYSDLLIYRVSDGLFLEALLSDLLKLFISPTTLKIEE